MRPKTYYIPHPLCGNDDRAREKFFATPKEEQESLTEYMKNGGNPRWAASHLVRAIANGLEKADPEVSWQLWEIANRLAESQKRPSPPDPSSLRAWLERITR